MKVFELFEKQPLREARTLNASIKLCEGLVNVLEGMDVSVTSKGKAGDDFTTKGKIKVKSGGKVKAFKNENDAKNYFGSRRWKELKNDPKVKITYPDTNEGLNDAGEFDFDPDPAFAGVKGVTRDTGAGNKEADMAQQKQKNAKLNQTWQKLIKTLGTMNPAQAETMKQNMLKVAKSAQKNNFTLSPSPEQVLGL